MRERLLEGWLDSAGERTYQAPFCQALHASGYTVLHSTRHAPIEFGKDVIGRAADGTLCAFQLKGNPSSRLTHAQFREIQPQLWELATQAIVFPGVPNEPHRSFLVTNGNVDEEVQRAIDDMNRRIQPMGIAPIEVWTRGHLLRLFNDHATDFWPTEIPDVHRLFQLLALRGDEQPPLDMLHDVLTNVLLLGSLGEARAMEPEVRRRITSAAVIVAVCLRSFSQRENHYAVLAAWTLYVTYAVAACRRWGYSIERNAGGAIEIARETIIRSLLDLAEEVGRRTHHGEGHPFVDAAVYAGRTTLLVGLLSALWLICRREDRWPREHAREVVETFLKNRERDLELWGEGAMPQCLAYHWYLRANDAGMGPDWFLAGLLRATTAIRHDGDDEFTLLPPYYSFEDVRRHQLARITGLEDPLADDSRRAASWFAEPIFHLLVRTGLKRTCKEEWPDLTRIGHEGFEPGADWEFCLWRAEHGNTTQKLLRYEQSWSEIVEEARAIATPEVPEFLRGIPDLLLLYAIVCPHRATGNVVRFLGRTFNESWFIDPPVE